MQQYWLWTDWLEGQLCTKGPGIPNHILRCIIKDTDSKLREVFIPIFLELLCFLLDYYVWCGALVQMIDIHKLETV